MNITTVAAVALVGAVYLFATRGNAPRTMPPAPPRSPVPGYRRARQDEVTPEMEADAQAALSRPLGTVVHRDGYALLVEPHANAPKGVSVFLPLS